MAGWAARVGRVADHATEGSEAEAEGARMGLALGEEAQARAAAAIGGEQHRFAEVTEAGGVEAGGLEDSADRGVAPPTTRSPSRQTTTAAPGASA